MTFTQYTPSPDVLLNLIGKLRGTKTNDTGSV
jgi:hypothetical protein